MKISRFEASTLQRPLRLSLVAGPTGSGKSTLTRALSSLYKELTVVVEPDVHRLHGSTRSPTWYETQLAVVRLREEELLRVVTPVAVMDRHFSEDRAVFFRMHRELRHVSIEEYEALVAEALLIERRVPPLESVVYVTAADDILRTRMRRSGQPRWLVDTLEMQLDLYAGWLQRRSERVMQIDTSHESIEEAASAALDWILANRRGASA